MAVVFLLIPLSIASFTHQTASLSNARVDLAGAVIDNIAFFAGGWTSSDTYSDVVDAWSATSNSWTSYSALSQVLFLILLSTSPQPRSKLAGASTSSVAAFGGGECALSCFSDVVDIWDKVFWTVATLSVPRSLLAAAGVDGKILFAGGQAAGGRSATVDVLDVATGTWSLAALAEARSGLASCTVQDRWAVFAGGWAAGGRTASVDFWDSTTNTWTNSPNGLSLARSDLAGAGTNTACYFAGGSAPGIVQTVDIWHASDNVWSTISLDSPRSYAAATTFKTASVLLAGGEILGGSFSDSVWVIESDFSPGPSLGTTRAYATAVTVDQNTVVVAGGYLESGDRTDAVDIINWVAPSDSITDPAETTPSADLTPVQIAWIAISIVALVFIVALTIVCWLQFKSRRGPSLRYRVGPDNEDVEDVEKQVVPDEGGKKIDKEAIEQERGAAGAKEIVDSEVVVDKSVQERVEEREQSGAKVMAVDTEVVKTVPEEREQSRALVMAVDTEVVKTVGKEREQSRALVMAVDTEVVVKTVPEERKQSAANDRVDTANERMVDRNVAIERSKPVEPEQATTPQRMRVVDAPTERQAVTPDGPFSANVWQDEAWAFEKESEEGPEKPAWNSSPRQRSRSPLKPKKSVKGVDKELLPSPQRPRVPPAGSPVAVAFDNAWDEGFRDGWERGGSRSPGARVPRGKRVGSASPKKNVRSR